MGNSAKRRHSTQLSSRSDCLVDEGPQHGNEHLDHLAETAAKAISNIKFDKVIVWENGGQNGQSATTGFLQSFARTLPPMMQIMKDIGGVEVPEYLARFTTENCDVPHAATAAASNGADGAATGVHPPAGGHG